MMELVSWDDDIPNIWKHVPNHQSDKIIHLNCFSTGVPQKGGSIAGMRSCIMFLFLIEFLRLMLAICLFWLLKVASFKQFHEIGIGGIGIYFYPATGSPVCRLHLGLSRNRLPPLMLDQLPDEHCGEHTLSSNTPIVVSNVSHHTFWAPTSTHSPALCPSCSDVHTPGVFELGKGNARVTAWHRSRSRKNKRSGDLKNGSPHSREDQGKHHGIIITHGF